MCSQGSLLEYIKLEKPKSTNIMELARCYEILGTSKKKRIKKEYMLSVDL